MRNKIIVLQLVLALLASAVLMPVSGLVAAYSALAGGMIAVVANAFFAMRLFNDKVSWEPGALTATVYRGAVGKFILSVAMFFVAVVLLEPVNLLALFATYLLVQLSPVVFAVMQQRD